MTCRSTQLETVHVQGCTDANLGGHMAAIENAQDRKQWQHG
jgi:hypothetical protein